MIDKINVRVYGTAVLDGKVLILFEEYAGEKLLKLPGGGLEFGDPGSVAGRRTGA